MLLVTPVNAPGHANQCSWSRQSPPFATLKYALTPICSPAAVLDGRPALPGRRDGVVDHLCRQPLPRGRHLVQLFVGGLAGQQWFCRWQMTVHVQVCVYVPGKMTMVLQMWMCARAICIWICKRVCACVRTRANDSGYADVSVPRNTWHTDLQICECVPEQMAYGFADVCVHMCARANDNGFADVSVCQSKWPRLNVHEIGPFEMDHVK
eukprot:1156285-Pelagomonas_calceolata.AAC.5